MYAHQYRRRDRGPEQEQSYQGDRKVCAYLRVYGSRRILHSSGMGRHEKEVGFL